MNLAYAFENLMLFRRLVILAMICFTVLVTWWSFQLALQLGPQGMNGTDIVAVMIAMQTPVTALTGYLFKLYDKQRGNTNAGNN